MSYLDAFRTPAKPLNSHNTPTAKTAKSPFDSKDSDTIERFHENQAGLGGDVGKDEKPQKRIEDLLSKLPKALLTVKTVTPYSEIKEIEPLPEEPTVTIGKLASTLTEARSDNLKQLADELANRHRLPVESCLLLLDQNDRALIADGDREMLSAWAAAVRWHSANGLDPASYLEPGGKHDPSLAENIDCKAEVPSPANVGQYQRWSSDRHSCQRFEQRGGNL